MLKCIKYSFFKTELLRQSFIYALPSAVCWATFQIPSEMTKSVSYYRLCIASWILKKSSTAAHFIQKLLPLGTRSSAPVVCWASCQHVLHENGRLPLLMKTLAYAVQKKIKQLGSFFCLASDIVALTWKYGENLQQIPAELIIRRWRLPTLLNWSRVQLKYSPFSTSPSYNGW